METADDLSALKASAQVYLGVRSSWFPVDISARQNKISETRRFKSAFVQLTLQMFPIAFTLLENCHKEI
jgi:hypothetical protein